MDIRRTLGPVRWTKAVDGATAATSPPSSATDGFAADPERRGEYLHVAMDKSDAVTVRVWGYAQDTAGWYDIGEIAGGDAHNEADVLVAAGIYDRYAVDVVSIASGSVTVWVGEGK